MDENIIRAVLKHNATTGFSIVVEGTSMSPVLNANDLIFVVAADSYTVGDIVLFFYKDELLVHRILKIYDKRYYCKGDNSLRLEDVDYTQIIGKVVLCNNNEIPPLSQELLELSYEVSCVFRKSGYSKHFTINSDTYLKYKKKLNLVFENRKKG